MENKKNQQKQISDINIVNTLGVDYSLLFNGRGFELYVFKRLEKIALAVHMLSSLLTDTEPAKSRLKELSLITLGGGISLMDDSRGISLENTTKIISSLTEINSIFEILSMSKIISQMNCEIIKEEVTKLVNTILTNNDFNSFKRASFLAKDFFKVEDYSVDNRNTFTKDSLGFMGTNSDKGQKDIKDSNVSYKNTVEKTGSIHSSQEDKNKRQVVIMSMLKDGKNLTVKDFSMEIKGCSEKTIQRELLALVASGSIKKEGERRWSKYSLI
jgi:hypothetical protein